MRFTKRQQATTQNLKARDLHHRSDRSTDSKETSEHERGTEPYSAHKALYRMMIYPGQIEALEALDQ
jgi:hypothetical protein